MSEGAVPASRQTLRRCIRSAKDLLTSEVRWRALTLAALLVGFLLAITGLNVVNSYVARNFMTAIADRDMPGFTRQALLYLAVFAASTGVEVLYQFIQDRLALLWRQWLTWHLTDEYLAGHAYYRIKMRAEIDNPDQRICEDVRTYTSTLLSFFLVLLNSTITAIASNELISKRSLGCIPALRR